MSNLFADAERGEDPAEQVVRQGPAGDVAERIVGAAQRLGRQVERLGGECGPRLDERERGGAQGLDVARAR